MSCKKNVVAIDFIKHNYNKMTVGDISHSLGLSIGSIRWYLSKLKLKCYKKKQYDTNHNYFKDLNSKSAYIIGFTMADGCVRVDKNRYRILYTLQLQDVEILNFIKNEIVPNANIKYYRDNEACLRFNSQVLLEDLGNFGVIQRKSGKERLLNISKEYFYDYLRGLFDGDGTVGIYDKKGLKSKDYKVGIYCSNLTFLEELRDFEGNNLGNISNSKQPNGNSFYCWKIGKMSEIKFLYEKFYNNECFALDRKKIKMKEIVDYGNR